MPRVTFNPVGKAGDVPEGVSLLEAARRLGVALAHECGGFATCSTCRVIVEAGAEHLTEIGLDEENMLEEADLLPPYRLGCQAKVTGDVTITIPSQKAPTSE